MAHNFHLAPTGRGVYISKSGNDSNSGTDPNAPIRTLLQLGTLNLSYNEQSIIGTGTYILPTDPSWTQRTGILQADGTVKILGDSQTLSQVAGSYGSYFRGIIFDKFMGINLRPNLYDADCTYYNCIIKVLPDKASSRNSGSGSNVTVQDCILFNVNGVFPNSYFFRCIFVNCNITALQVADSYLDATSAVYTQSNGYANNNNVDPGCVPSAGYGFSHQGAPLSLASPGGISAYPNFNSVVKEDFTLRATSAHITRGIGPSQYRYANSFYFEFSGGSGDQATQANTRLRATGTSSVVPLLDMTTGTQSFEVNSQGGLVLVATDTSTGYGTFVTSRIAFADVADEMTAMLLKAGLNFDTDYPALESQFNMNQPEIFNNNVPDFGNYAPGAAGRTPNRLTYKMRWSTKLNPNADLANVNDWVSGTNFIEFEWNQKPLWNPATGIGNGDPSFNITQGQPIQCTFYQLMVCLRNNYYK